MQSVTFRPRNRRVESGRTGGEAETRRLCSITFGIPGGAIIRERAGTGRRMKAATRPVSESDSRKFAPVRRRLRRVGAQRADSAGFGRGERHARRREPKRTARF